MKEMFVTSALKSFGTLLLLCWITTLGSTNPRIIRCPEGTSVKDGYIKNGTEATCKCVGYQGNSSSPYWVVNGGDAVVETKGPGYSVLSVTMRDINRRFICMMDDVKGTTLIAGPFVPKFAYGPSEIQAEVSTFRQCYYPRTRVNITCSIPSGTVNPYPEVTIVTDPLTRGVTSQMNHSEYKFVYTFYAENDHKRYNFTCTARNGIFGDLVLTKSRDFFVRVSTPTIRVNDGPELTNDMTAVVAENETVTLHCQVEYALHRVSMSLTCQQQQTQQQQQQQQQKQQQQRRRRQKNVGHNSLTESLTRTFTRAQSGVTCTCTVRAMCEKEQTKIAIIVENAGTGSSDDAASSSAMDAGEVVGIVLAAILVIIVITVTGICWLRHKRANYRLKEREHYDTLNVQESDAHPYRDLQHSAETRPQALPAPHKPLSKVRTQQSQTSTSAGNQAVRTLKPQNPTPFTGSMHSAKGHGNTDTSARDSNTSDQYEDYIESLDSSPHYNNGTQAMGFSNYGKPEHTQSHYSEPQIKQPLNYTERENASSHYSEPENIPSHYPKPHVEQSSDYIEPADPPSESSNYTECGNTLSHYSEPEDIPSHYLKPHIKQSSDYIEPVDPPSEYTEPSFPQYESLQGQGESSSPHYSQLSGQKDPTYTYSGLTNQVTEYEELTDEHISGYVMPKDPPTNNIN